MGALLLVVNITLGCLQVYMTYIWLLKKTPESVKRHLSDRMPGPMWKTLYYGYVAAWAVYGLQLLWKGVQG